MRKLSLCSGIGADDLASTWAGIETVCFCEIDPFCQSVLRRHWPGVPIIADIKDVIYEQLAQNWQGTPPYTTVRNVAWGRPGGTGEIDIIAGGIPCQGNSIAGRRQGIADIRNLWPEVRRIVREIRPNWLLVENVPGIRSVNAGRFLGGILADLAAMGYHAGWCSYGACHFGAPHRRERVFIVAYAARPGLEGADSTLLATQILQQPPGFYGSPICGSTDTRLPDWSGGKFAMPYPITQSHRRAAKSVLCPMDAGPTGRLVRLSTHERIERIKALGNCNLPQMYYPIYKAIVEIERILA